MSFLPFFSVETWILLVTFIFLFVKYGSWTFGVFEKIGIPCPKPSVYLGSLGNMHKVYYQADLQCAAKYGRVWGVYELRKPVLFVMDPDMLKNILVKDCFTYFTNRRNFRLVGDLRDAVSLSEDARWRRLRNIISPSFSSGHIKEMFKLMKYHSSKMVKSLKDKAHNSEVITVKEVLGSYGIDVMGSCVLSVDMDLTTNPSSEIIKHAASFFRFPVLLFLFQGFFPFFLPLLELLDFSLFSKAAFSYFKNIVERVKQERDRTSNQSHTDFMQYLTKVQSSNQLKGENYDQVLSDRELICQLVLFVMAGYDTSATTMTFVAYNLARNPKTMEKLQHEIDATFPNKGAVEYEALMQMEYLDCVVSESLRLYPPAARLDRVSKETVSIKGITIPKNMVVTVPVYALHRDPELWPEPEEFRPERFSKENKQKIHPYSYLPFGAGPRNCVGMRFAQAMVKLALVEALQNYSFEVCSQTEYPLEMDPGGLVGPLRPIKLRLVMRSNDSK